MSEVRPIEDLFAELIELESPAERRDYLDRVCGDDRQLRDELERLVADHERAGSFLEVDEPLDATEDGSTSHHPGTQIGPYKLREQIGEGGMGVVFVAEQERPMRRKVALKVIKPGMDSKEVIARFEAERQALALMNHPNIAKVLDAGTTDSGRPYFVMELVNGIPITEYCDRYKLSTRERLALFMTVCQAVQHAHQKGVIHRDLKPSNTLITELDGSPAAKVIDFGVAKAINQRLTERTIYTRFQTMVGTPMYMSPEQAELSGMDVDTRSDIYSLGVLLYELITGSTPFDKQRLQKAAFDEIRRIICEEEPPKPSTKISTLGETATEISEHRRTDPHKLRSQIAGDLDWIVMKALDKDRARRYRTADAFATDIERYLQDEPIEARPPSTAYWLRKTISRHRSALATVATFSLVLIAATITSTWLAVQMRQARDEAINASALMEQAKNEAVLAHRRAESTLKELWEVLAEQALDAAFSARRSEAEEAIDKAEVAGAPPDLLDTLRGLVLFFDGQNEDAIARLQSAVANKPDSVPALSALAWVSHHAGEVYSREHIYARLRKLDLTRSEAPYNEFFLCLARFVGGSKKQLEDSLDRLDTLIARRRGWGAAYSVRAAVRMEYAMESRELQD